MYSVTRLLDVAENDSERILRQLRTAAVAAQPRRWVVQHTLAGSRNGGDILMHLRFETEVEWDCVAGGFTALIGDPAVSRVNGAVYAGTPVRSGVEPGTVYRTLLLRVAPDASDSAVARFENELSSLARFLPTIRAWQLSRVSKTLGATEWTHVLEQEFADADALTGPYLLHPIHWAMVDRWFDPECPEVIVRERVCHSFCPMPSPVLS